MRTTTLRVGLSLMVVISLWAGRLAAQEVYVVPTVPFDPDHHAPSPNLIPRPAPPPAKHLYKQVLNHFGMACQPDPWNYPFTFHQEMNWMFGSTRTWFNEPCIPTLPCAERRAQQQPQQR